MSDFALGLQLILIVLPIKFLIYFLFPMWVVGLLSKYLKNI